MTGTKPTLPLDPDDFAWPYSGMIHDLTLAIKGAANLLAGIGLLVLTEILGRIILLERRPSGTKPAVDKAEAFALFYEEYMGQPLGSGRRIYGVFRSGLLHTLAFEKASESIVPMMPRARWMPAESIGPVFEAVGGQKTLSVSAYWRDW